MKKRGKKYLEALNKIEKGKAYTKEEAVKLAKETSVSNFDASVEVAVRLNLDTKKADQQLRGAIVLPNGTGKTKKVLVVARGENAKKAKEAGADFVGDVDMLEKIEKENWFGFDVMIATPDMMPLLGKLGKILGPKGLMPNPKTGTVTTDVEKAVKEYISELKNIYVEMDELNTGINPNNIFTAQNMQDKDFSEIDDIIKEYKEKSKDAVTELEGLLTEEKIAENINKRNISTRKEYYVDLYNTIMTSDSMKKQYNVIEEKVKEEKDKLTDKINKIDKIAEFLEKNSDSWEIKDDKIQFTNLNRMTEYYSLLNKLTD